MEENLKAFKIINKIWKIFEEEAADEKMIENILEAIYITNIQVKMIKEKEQIRRKNRENRNRNNKRCN